jgi:DNA-binding response OmpR family regulator
MEGLHVLVVDADPDSRRMLEHLLQPLSDLVVAVGSAEAALVQLAEHRFAVLVTDVLLPDRDGIDLLAEAGRQAPHVSMIVYSSFVTVDVMMRALRRGACTYIRKPEGATELVARVRGELERRRSEQERTRLLQMITSSLIGLAEPQDGAYRTVSAPALRRVGCLTIDPARRRVLCNDQPVALSKSEFALLDYLAHHHDQVLSPQQIVRSVFGYDCSPYEARDLIKPRIHRLRRKIETDPSAPRLLLSVRGAGYLLSGEPE